MRYLYLFLLVLVSAFAQGQNIKCHQGEQNFPKDSSRTQDPLDDTSTSGGISADPNEIIGPMGYESIHWVSGKDVYNYTILFENDPEFATAN